MSNFSRAPNYLRIDWTLLGLTLAICGAGLVLLYSAGYSVKLGYSPVMQRQAYSMGLGSLGLLLAVFLGPRFWRHWSFPIYVFACLLLLAILFGGVVAGGARRWLEIGGLRFQPSEFSKVALILVLAKVFSKDGAPKGEYGFLSLILPAVLILIPMGLIVVEPDLGTALCHALIGGSMLLVAGVKRGVLIKLALAGIILALPAWGLLKDYQKQRILTFLSPEQDPLGSGYHAIQSQIAVGSGSVFGKGLLEGTQTQLRFLPEQTTDFIFSVMAEEWGFIGSVSLMLLYGLLIFKMCSLATDYSEGFSEDERFVAFCAVGVAALFFWHVSVNVGMVLGVLPVVGLTLPLVSFGGSSAIAFLGAVGVLAGAKKIRTRERLYGKLDIRLGIA